MAITKFDGVTMRFGDRDLIVPPLNFRLLKSLKSEISKLRAATADDQEAFDALIAVVHGALSRNYPEITRAEVEEWLDLGNQRQLIAAVMGQSGLVPGEATPGR